MMTRYLLAASLMLLTLSCNRPTALAEGAPGSLSVSWAGKYDGRFRVEAEGTWCSRDSMLQIAGIRGDTGVGLALFVPDTVRPVPHPVISPAVVVDWRPLAFAAVRWFGESDVVGFEASGGVITVTAVDSGVTGTVDVRLRAPNGIDTLHLTGGFTRIPVRPAEGTCGRLKKGKAG